MTAKLMIVAITFVVILLITASAFEKTHDVQQP